MKKILTVLNFLLFVTLVILTLYIFDVIDIPFLHPKEPEVIIKQTETEETSEIEEPEVVEEEPQEKITRKKTYNELLNKGNVYYENGFYNLAIDSFTQANQENPTKSDPLLRISDIQLLLEEFEQAKDLSLALLKIAPESTEGKINLGKSYIGLEDFTNAKNIFDSITSDDQEVQYFQGMMALYFGEYERGRSLISSAINNENPSDVNEYAQNLLNALDEFDRYQAGQHTHLKVLLARSFVQTGYPQMSKNLLWDILKEKRDYRDAWIILGYSYLKLEAFDEAIDALEEAKRQDPEKPETLFYLGLAYSGNSQLSEAIDILELALSNGYEPRIHVEQKLAELYFQIEDYEKASDKFEDVISLNPSDANYFVRPIFIYIDKLQDPEKALSLAEKAHLHHPDNAMSYNLLGWAYVANQDYINAKKNLEKALELNDSFDAPYLNMGWMYEKQGNYERAKLLYKKAFDIGNNSPVAGLAAERYNALIDKELNSNIMVNLFN